VRGTTNARARASSPSDGTETPFTGTHHGAAGPAGKDLFLLEPPGAGRPSASAKESAHSRGVIRGDLDRVGARRGVCHLQLVMCEGEGANPGEVHAMSRRLRSLSPTPSHRARAIALRALGTLLVLVPCCKDPETTSIPEVAPPAVPADIAQRVAFVDGTEASGLSVAPVQGALSPPNRMLGGLAAADVDDDADIDLLVVYPGGRGVLLFENDQGVFQDVTGSRFDDSFIAGATGALWLDDDGDDDLDLVVLTYTADPPRLLRNSGGLWSNGPLAFPGLRYSISPTAGDVNGDGWLDLFVTHWNVNIDFFFGNGDLEGELTFLLYGGAEGWTEAPPEAGLNEVLLPYTFAGHVLDATDDGLPDLLIASDYGFSRIMANLDGGRFAELDVELTDQHGMGAALLDYDNDGDQDWFVTSIAAPPEFADYPEAAEYTGNRLYRNDGGGRFVDVSERAYIRDGGWGWGACAADFDNDGWIDLFHVNGFEPYQEFDMFIEDASRLFLNLGDGRFVDIAPHVGLVDLEQGRGVSCFDHDGDGDVDIMVMNYRAPLRLWRNEAPSRNHHLKVSLRGPPPNTRAIGASIQVRAGALVQTRAVVAGNGYIGQQPDEVHFGLAGHTTVDELRVTWPDGSVTTQRAIPADQRIVIRP